MEAADRLTGEAGVHGAVLLVDDDPATLSGLALLLQYGGITIYEASTGAGAVRSALAHRPDVVVLDNRLGSPEDMTGIDVIDALHAHRSIQRGSSTAGSWTFISRQTPDVARCFL